MVVQAVDPSRATPDRNWPAPFAHPGDRQCEYFLPCRLTDWRSDNPDDTARADTRPVEQQCPLARSLVPPLRGDAMFLRADCQNNVQRKNSIPTKAWFHRMPVWWR